MIFEETPLSGAYVVSLEEIRDERGFFARSLCCDEFDAYGLNTEWPQSNISYNLSKGTVRGMHYQIHPHAEVKLVRCSMGSIYDVILDLREDSSTYRQCYGLTLSSENRQALYIPEGFAHGFQTLTDCAEVLYQMSTCYVPESARGVCWDDPAFDVIWPLPVATLSEKDASYRPFA